MDYLRILNIKKPTLNALSLSTISRFCDYSNWIFQVGVNATEVEVIYKHPMTVSYLAWHPFT